MTPIQALTALGLIAEELRLEAEAASGNKAASEGVSGGLTQGKKLTDEQAEALFNDA